MSKYTLTIEGDFEMCECEKCTVGVVFGGNDKCFKINKYSCPLEEVKDKHRGVENCKHPAQTGLTKPNFCSICGADLRGD